MHLKCEMEAKHKTLIDELSLKVTFGCSDVYVTLLHAKRLHILVLGYANADVIFSLLMLVITLLFYSR